MEEFDFNSPKRLFLSLIRPVSFDDFFSKYWEEKPLHISRTPRQVGSDGLLSLSHRTLRTIIKNHSIQFNRDLDIFRFTRSHKKEILNEKGVVSLAKYDKLVTGGTASAFFYDLQRFQDNLWQILELLESFFGTLVGSYVCVSPTKAQRVPTSLKYSDAEMFVLQTEGETRWRIYTPTTSLPRHHHDDIDPDSVGDPALDVLLNAGSILYLPRGTIYQNVSFVTNTHATYLVMYTYQKMSWGDYLQSVFPVLLEEAINSEVDFRRGLPINFLKSTKLSKSSKVQSVLNILLLKLAKSRTDRFPLPRDMMEKFMSRRLPPFRANPALLRVMVDESTLPGGTPPDLSCKIRLRYPEHLCFLTSERTSERDPDLVSILSSCADSESLDDSNTSQLQFLSQSLLVMQDSQALLVFSSVLNSRTAHMLQSAPNADHCALALVLPAYFLPSLELLKASSDQYIIAASLPLENPDDREKLVRSLWSRHLLECVPGFRAQLCKSTKLD